MSCLVFLSSIVAFLITGKAVASLSSSEAPWQQSTPSAGRSNVVDEEMFGDQPPTVFAPGGRLYSVERTVAAASSMSDSSSNLVVALSCRDGGIVLVTTMPTSPHLDVSTHVDDEHDENEQDTTTTTAAALTTTPTKSLFCISSKGQHRVPLVQLSFNTWMVTGGNAVDSSILRFKVSRWARDMLEANDGGQPLPSTSISCAALAKRAANYLQEPTQTIGKAGRILASYALLVGKDEKKVFSLWRLDPTGQFWKCDATTIGRGFSTAEAHLLEMALARGTDATKGMSAFFTNLSSEEAIAIACECIEKVFPKDNMSYWQALVMRVNSRAKQDNVQVLNGEEIQLVLADVKSKVNDKKSVVDDRNTR